MFFKAAKQLEFRVKGAMAVLPWVAILVGVPFCSPGLRSEVSSQNAPSCSQAKWEEEPTSEDGHFEAKVSLGCKSGSRQSIATLVRRIQQALDTERSSHSQSVVSSDSQTWDVSHTFEQDGNSIHIREEVWLQEMPGAAVYRTRSKEIAGSGLSHYLKEVDVQAIFREGDDLGFDLHTRVRIKRPWYAPAFLFYPIAKRKTLDKAYRHALDFASRIADTTESPLP